MLNVHNGNHATSLLAKSRTGSYALKTKNNQNSGWGSTGDAQKLVLLVRISSSHKNSHKGVLRAQHVAQGRHQLPLQVVPPLQPHPRLDLSCTIKHINLCARRGQVVRGDGTPDTILSAQQ